MLQKVWVGALALVLALGAVDVAAQMVSWRLKSLGALVVVLALKVMLTAALVLVWAWRMRSFLVPPPAQGAQDARDQGAKEAPLPSETDLRRLRHDLLSPINAASGFLELLEKGIAGELNPKQSMYVKNIRDSVRKLAELAQSLKRQNA